MSKAPTYRGNPLPNALDGDETPEQAAEKLVGDGQSPALHVTRAIVARAIREDRLARSRTTEALAAVKHQPITITLARMAHTWQARLDGDRWCENITKCEAIGDLVQEYADEIGVRVVIAEEGKGS